MDEQRRGLTWTEWQRLPGDEQIRLGVGAVDVEATMRAVYGQRMRNHKIFTYVTFALAAAWSAGVLWCSRG